MMKVKFTDVFEDVTKYGTKISTDKYIESGCYPIVDQGKSQIAGYIDNREGLYENIPAIIFGDHTRVVKYIDFPCFLGADGVKLLKPKDDRFDCKYLYYVLSNARIPNTGYNRHYKWLKEVSIPIKSVEEQERIVSVLDKISELISLRRQQIEKLDELVKARFVELFGDFIERTSSVDFESICEFVTVGIANSATHAFCDDGVIMFRNQNIKEDYLDTSDIVNITPDFASKYKSKMLKKDDLLIVRTGYPGVACLVPEQYEGCQTFTTLIARLKNTDIINPRFVCHYINSEYGKKYVKDNSAGAAQQNFGATALSKLPICIPPIELQDEYIRFVEQTDKSKLTIQQSLDKLELLKKSLMQKYFG